MAQKLYSSTRVIDQSLVGSEEMTKKIRRVHHFAGYIETLTNSLNIFPVLFPLATLVCPRFVSSIPISHKYRRQLVVLQISLYIEFVSKD